jgi:hypothetical protein
MQVTFAIDDDDDDNNGDVPPISLMNPLARFILDNSGKVVLWLLRIELLPLYTSMCVGNGWQRVLTSSQIHVLISYCSFRKGGFGLLSCCQFDLTE